jgi:poly(3-hydroxybutyrate) depolymerase
MHRPDLNGNDVVRDRPRWSVPRGRIVLRALASDPTQEYLLYVPEAAPSDAPMIVSVHGMSGNAPNHAAVFSSLCDELGLVMLTPIFTSERHRDFQRLGRKGRGSRSDLLLHRVLAEAAALSGADPTRVHLVGFSAGAQFAHRYSMVHPDRVARAVVVAAGWYTFPDHRQRYPYGIRPVRALEHVSFDPEAFLRVPIDVVVGKLDTTTAKLRSTERTIAQQGRTRLERARNWVGAMRAAAEAHGLPSLVTLTEVDGVGHSFTDFTARGDLVGHVRRALFADTGVPPDPSSRQTNAAEGAYPAKRRHWSAGDEIDATEDARLLETMRST